MTVDYRAERYKDMRTAAEIDAKLIELTALLHATTSMQMRAVVREEQDYLLDLRNQRVGKPKRGTRVPRR